MVLQENFAEIVLQKGCKKTCKTSVLKFENMWLEFFVELKNVNNWVRYQSVSNIWHKAWESLGHDFLKDNGAAICAHEHMNKKRSGSDIDFISTLHVAKN